MADDREHIDAARLSRRAGRRKGVSSLLTQVIRWVILYSCLPNILVSAQEPDGSSAAAIRALEREWVDAQSHNNNQALNLILDNAVVYVEYGQLVTKGDYLSRIKHLSAGTDEVEMGPLRIQIFGSTAIAVGSYAETQRGEGRRIVTRWRFIDTWTYKERGWVLVAAAATPVR